jgi:hypothetical protein
MRAYKVARQRREMSPDQYQTALQTALQAIPGICGYYWRKSFCKRGHPSVHIIVLLGYSIESHVAAEATVEMLYRELDELFVNMAVFVTHSSSAFWTMREFTARA